MTSYAERTQASWPNDLPARSLLARTRAEWRRRVLVRAVLVGVALAVGVAAVLAAVDQAVALPVGARAMLRLLPLVLAAAPIVRAAKAAFGPLDPARVALLAEESRPELGYQLSTLVGAGPETALAPLFRGRALAHVASVEGPVVRVDAGRHARNAGIALAAALGVLLATPGGPRELIARWAHLSAGPSSGLGAPGLPAAGRTADDAQMSFRDLEIRVDPPAYTGLAAFDLAADGEATVLAGSRVTVRALLPESVERVEARVLGSGHASDVPVDGRTAQLTWQIASSDRGLELVALEDTLVRARAVVPLVVADDAVPEVELSEPSQDLVLATPNGKIPVRATARDDYGVASFRLEWILTRGSGESFAFTDGVTEWRTTSGPERARAGTVELDMKGMGLEAGDVLHVRARASDRNDVSGPGVGTSITRVIRIAEEGKESEANTLIGFPIEGEPEPIMGERWIILLTEKLIAEMPGLPRQELQRQAGLVADDQMRVRERLEKVAYPPSAGANPDDPDTDPAAAVNRDLIPAINEMFEAERRLRALDPRTALAAEYRALALVERFRESDRVFLTADPTIQPIDVAAARGTGKLDGAEPTARTAAPVSASLLAHVGRLEELAARLRSNASPATLSIEASAAAAALLEDRSVDPRAGALLARAAQRALAGDAREAGVLVAQTRSMLLPPSGRGAVGWSAPSSAASAGFLAAISSRGGPDGSPRVTATKGGIGSPASPFVFATLRYGSGDWNASPLVPTNLIHSLAIYTGLAVAPDGVVVDLSSPDIFGFPFLYLNGHLPVQLTAAEAANLKTYVDRGGFVFIDDHNHNTDGSFHKTVMAEMTRIFGDGALKPLPNDHELYRAFFTFEDGPPTTTHELNGWGDGLVHEQLLAYRKDGRIRVLYSNKDYSSEWSYHAANKRFQARDNTRFGVNILVYALTR